MSKKRHMAEEIISKLRAGGTLLWACSCLAGIGWVIIGSAADRMRLSPACQKVSPLP